MRDVQFGLGLVSLGRPWGLRRAPLPSRLEALRFLDLAVHFGVHVFDTAPAYGASEALLGEFLQGLSHELGALTIATKCGEHWDEQAATPYVDHSFEAMRRSIDRSLARLPHISLLQLHKASADALRSDHVAKALDYARSCGIAVFGASVSDSEALRIALEDPRIEVVQMSYNQTSRGLEEAFQFAPRLGKRLFINRPFAMGALVYDSQGNSLGPASCVDAYRFVLRHDFRGVILTGTRSETHLHEDLEAFRNALSSF